MKHLKVLTLYSVYLLYWYKSTNADAMHACQDEPLPLALPVPPAGSSGDPTVYIYMYEVALMRCMHLYTLYHDVCCLGL